MKTIQSTADEGDLYTGSRVCRRCHERKPMAEFYWQRKDQWRKRTCRGCQMKHHRGDRASARRKHLYGLSKVDFEWLIAVQFNRCGICQRSFDDVAPHVDHDHATGAVRGLLCTNCNCGIGQFGEDQTRLRAALEYLAS